MVVPAVAIGVAILGIAAYARSRGAARAPEEYSIDGPAAVSPDAPNSAGVADTGAARHKERSRVLARVAGGWRTAVSAVARCLGRGSGGPRDAEEWRDFEMGTISADAHALPPLLHQTTASAGAATAVPGTGLPSIARERTQRPLPPIPLRSIRCSPPVAPAAAASAAAKTAAARRDAASLAERPEIVAEPTHASVCGAAGIETLSAEFTALVGNERTTFDRTLRMHFQGHHEDYCQKRILAGKPPLTFEVVAAYRVRNASLERLFEARRARMAGALGRTDAELGERVAFHGTRPDNVDRICALGLLRSGHAWASASGAGAVHPSTDPGYFGDSRLGVYACCYVEYALQYSNARIAASGRQVPVPVCEGDVARVVMFKVLPGRTRRLERALGPIPPTDGCDSHMSPSGIEWYFFDESQLCPTYVVDVRAIVDVRVTANDGL